MKVCPHCHTGTLSKASTCSACGKDLSSTLPRENKRLEGMVLKNRYRLLSFLKEGGMGWIYRGEQMEKGNLVAVKLMKRGDLADEEAAERFLKEASAASRIDHLHVVTVLDSGQSKGGLPYIICELLEGNTLFDLITSVGPLPLIRALSITNQIFAAVEEIHHKGVIHRDLKPDNVMVSPRPSGQDFIKVLDFGIAQTAGEETAQGVLEGQIVGTPAYMAPEQAKGYPAVEASDLYSCALILFELLTGWQPFIGKTDQETLSKQIFDNPPSIFTKLSREDAPEGLDDFFQRALAKDPHERYQTAAELRRALFDIFPARQLRKLPCRRCHRLPGSAAHCSGEAADEPYLELTPRSPLPLTVDRPAGARFPREGTPTISLRGMRQQLDAMPPLADEEPARSAAPGGGLPARLKEQTRLLTFIAGPDRLLELIGPPGSGKSSLLAQAARVGRAHGYQILNTNAAPPLARGPWYSIRSLLESLLLPPGVSADLSALEAGMHAMGLGSGDLPGLMDIFGLERETAGAPLATRFEEAVASARRVLARTAAKTGGRALLLMDDLARFDTPSLRVVQALCRGRGRSFGPGLKAILASEGSHLSNQESLETLPLRAIPLHEVRGVLGGGGSDFPDRVVKDLAKKAGPGLLYLNQAGWYLVQGGEAPPPCPLRRLIPARLAQLTPDQRSLLALYAVAGPSILPGDEGALLPAGVDWMEARGELERQDLVQLNHPHGAPMCHPTVAELVKMELPDDSLVGLQRRIMERLEQRGGADIFTLSSLALGAEMGERSFQLQQDAGQRALELLDLESKGRIFLERALAVATRELLLPADDERMQQLILEVAEANGGAGHHLAAEELLYQLLDLLPEKGGELQARTRLALGLILETRAEPERARAWLEQAAEDLNGLQAHKLLTEIYGRLGELLLAQGEETTLLAEMEVWAGRLMEAADQAIPVPWHLLLLETAARYKTGDPEGALDAADRAISSAQEEGSLAGEARARLVQGQLDRVNEQPDRTEEQLARAHILFLRVGDRMGAARCLRALSGQRPSGRELLEAAARDLEQQVKGHRMPE